MTFELICTNGKFSIDNLFLSEITDLFTITKLNDDSFSITDGESHISLSARSDDSIEMYYSIRGKSFYCKGCKFVIHSFDSFDTIHLLDESSCNIFSTAIDKVIV